DNKKEAIDIIKKNIEKTHFEEQVKTHQLPFENLLKNEIKEKVDIVYIDPPYNTDYAYDAVKIILEKQILNKDAIMIIETDKENRIIDQINNLNIEITDKRKYGRAHLIFLRKKEG
ncbi:MAG: RsmD family RNA methyltransferase, partial [Clostridia bacterium]|nr:RsmD family RNA methyltransferase [Clostridia bacterium]